MPRYDDDFDERRSPHENPTNAGMIGFILAMAALALIFVVAILWYAMNIEDQQMQNMERRRLMFYWFLTLDVLDFFIALVATVFAGRALSPTNPLYRGWATTALVLGILEMLFAAFAFFVLTCFTLLAHA